MEKTFQRVHYPDVSVVDRMCNMLNLTPERIAVWFQNRRARFKKSKKDPSSASSFDTIQDNDSMLREVEKLLDGNSSSESLNVSAEKVSKSKITNKTKKASIEQIPVKNEAETINLIKNDAAKLDDCDLKKSIAKPKPIFNPMSYSPNPSPNYQTYSQNEPLINQPEYYAYGPQFLVQQHNQDSDYQLKLPISTETNVNQDNINRDQSDSSSSKSSRSSTPDSNDSSSSPEQIQNQDLNENANSNNYTANYQPHMFAEMNGHNQNAYQNMSYHNHHPAHYNPSLFQPYYNLPDFQNNSYFSGIYSQFQNVASSYNQA